MKIREGLFASALAAAGWFIYSGVAAAHAPAGRVVAGILIASGAWLVLGEDGP